MKDAHAAICLAFLVGMAFLFVGMWIENSTMKGWPFLGREDLVKCHKRLQQIADDLRAENGKLWRRNQKLEAENLALRERVRELERELETYKQPIDFPKLREDVAHVDNSLGEYLEDSIKRAAARP